MRIVARLRYEDVLREFRAAHGVDTVHEENTNHDAAKHLGMAQEQYGHWAQVLLSREEIRAIVLPWHVSEGGAVALVPKSGRTVAQAVDAIRDTGGRFATESPVCWHKLMRLRTEPFAGIYLSTRAIEDEIDYLELRTRHGLIHLDGLHRLVSWELHGMLTDRTEVLACVAGVSDACLAG